MKQKILFTFFIFLYFNLLSLAQNVDNKNVDKNLVFLETGGFGGYGSINYEYLINKINKLKLSVRIGLSTYHLNDYTNQFNPDLIIPIAINAYYGNRHNIDLGFGQTITSIVYADDSDYKPKRSNSLNTNISIGYRYQKVEGGVMFKVAYAPIIEKNELYRHWLLLSFGYSF